MSKKTRMPQATVDLVHARSGMACEARIPGAGCDRGLDELHHRKFRSGGGDHSVGNILAVCKHCHEWIHQNKRAAMRDGWAISSHSTLPAEEIPVTYQGNPGLLHETGRVEFLLVGVPQQ